MGSFSVDDVKRALSEWRAPKMLQDFEAAAAVSIVLRQTGTGPQVLLIRRAEHPSDPWSGHMAFPGGRQDATDADLLMTARRETAEEVGLDLSSGGASLGALDDIQAVGRGKKLGLIVRPHVFEVADQMTSEAITIDRSEVAEAVWADLLPMARGEIDATRPYIFQGNEVPMPAYNVEGRIVWGMTYHILRTFFRLVRGELV